jgi:hypothetical protein
VSRQGTVAGARVEPEQSLNFGAQFVRDLSTLQIGFPLIGRQVGNLVEEILNFAFQLVVPIPAIAAPLLRGP